MFFSLRDTFAVVVGGPIVIILILQLLGKFHTQILYEHFFLADFLEARNPLEGLYVVNVN